MGAVSYQHGRQKKNELNNCVHFVETSASADIDSINSLFNEIATAIVHEEPRFGTIVILREQKLVNLEVYQLLFTENKRGGQDWRPKLSMGGSFLLNRRLHASPT